MILIYNSRPNSIIGEYIYRVVNSGFGVILVLISSISTVLLFVLPLFMIEKIGKKSFLSFFLLNPLSVNKKHPNKN
ncbi:type IV secretory pathway VirB3-like protein [Bacillus fengqiuensis]|nr:type IV secretory pathway VirB3-like protein [Bacillus fengqiuensis]